MINIFYQIKTCFRTSEEPEAVREMLIVRVLNNVYL